MDFRGMMTNMENGETSIKTPTSDEVASALLELGTESYEAQTLLDTWLARREKELMYATIEERIRFEMEQGELFHKTNLIPEAQDMFWTAQYEANQERLHDLAQEVRILYYKLFIAE